MHVDVAAQGQIFLLSLLLGAILGLVYDVLRAVRRSAGRRGLAFVLDVLFWLSVVVLLFWVALFRENGRVRLYVSAAFLAGAGLYLLTLSRLVLPGLLQILDWLGKFWRLLTAPVRKGAGLAKKVCGKRKKDFQNWVRWYRITMDYYHPENCEEGASVREGQTRRHRHKNSDTRSVSGSGDRASVHALTADVGSEPEGSAAGSGAGSGGEKRRSVRRYRPQR
jgi:spore cortex biosynthesis protein YabQ